MEYLGDTAQIIQAFKCEMWPLTYTTHTHLVLWAQHYTCLTQSLVFCAVQMGR